MSKDTQLSINTEVISKITEIAAKEIEGVTGLCKKAIDFKTAVKNAKPFKGVKIESINGALKINVYICVKQGLKIEDTAEKVQANVKEKVQNMTGAAVTKVDVIVADIEFEKEEKED